MGRISPTQNHHKVVEKGICEPPGCAWEGLHGEELSGEESIFNEAEGRKTLGKEASGTKCEVLPHADRTNGMFEFFNSLLLVFEPGKFKIFLINIMSLEAMNNSLSFRLTRGLEDRLNHWVPQ